MDGFTLMRMIRSDFGGGDLVTGVLVIAGQGDMPDYSYSGSYAPWYSYRDTITAVVFPETLDKQTGGRL